MGNIGRKILLHSVPFPGDSDAEDRFVLVEIVEVKQVPCVWNQKETNEGWKALGEDGNYYYCNWETFPDDSSSPTWTWETKRKVWYDITQGMFDPIPFRPKFMDKYSDVIYWCPTHMSLHMHEKIESRVFQDFFKERGKDPNNPCFDCLMDREPPKLYRGWKGWR